jgi:hypothetical protein
LNYASLLIPRRYITAEVLSVIEKHFVDARSVFDSDDDVLCFSDTEAPSGRFPAVESLLVKRGIPFNRSGGSPEHERKFRPSRDGKELVDVEICYFQGKVMIDTEQIRAMLDPGLDPHEALSSIKDVLNEVNPEVSELKEWANWEIPIISTTEVELSRFSDIL